MSFVSKFENSTASATWRHSTWAWTLISGIKSSDHRMLAVLSSNLWPPLDVILRGFECLFLFFKIRNIPAEMGSKFFSCTHYPHTLTFFSVWNHSLLGYRWVVDFGQIFLDTLPGLLPAWSSPRPIVFSLRWNHKSRHSWIILGVELFQICLVLFYEVI